MKGEEGLLSASKEVSSTKFGKNVQVQLVEGGASRKTLMVDDEADTAILRSSGNHCVQERQQHLQHCSRFHSRPDMSSRWRFYLERVRSDSP